MGKHVDRYYYEVFDQENPCVFDRQNTSGVDLPFQVVPTPDVETAQKIVAALNAADDK